MSLQHLFLSEEKERVPGVNKTKDVNQAKDQTKLTIAFSIEPFHKVFRQVWWKAISQNDVSGDTVSPIPPDSSRVSNGWRYTLSLQLLWSVEAYVFEDFFSVA